MTDDAIIAEILRREGGYVDHPADRGGPTKHGITQETLADWRGHAVTIDDVKALTEAEAARIYRDRYIDRPGFGAIGDDALRSLMVDCAVNHGPRAAVRMMQRAVGFELVDQDGILGPKTRDAVNALTAPQLYLRVCAERVREYGRIISKNQTQAVFAAGWLNRAASFIEDAVPA